MNFKSSADSLLHSADFDKYNLPDVVDISIPDAEPKEKMRAFLQAVGNPYLFRVGDIGVHVAYTGMPGDTLQDRICHLLLKSI